MEPGVCVIGGREGVKRALMSCMVSDMKDGRFPAVVFQPRGISTGFGMSSCGRRDATRSRGGGAIATRAGACEEFERIRDRRAGAYWNSSRYREQTPMTEEQKAENGKQV